MKIASNEKELRIDKIQVIPLRSGHRIYATDILGKLYFYSPEIKKWIPNESMEIGTHEEYVNYRKNLTEKIQLKQNQQYKHNPPDNRDSNK